MTQEEEKYLRELRLLVDRLIHENSELKEGKQRLQYEIDTLRQQLLSSDLEAEEYRDKYTGLVAAKVIAEEESDWLAARSRLENMRKQVREAISLLQTEQINGSSEEPLE